MSVNKLETLEVSGTPEDIGFAIGQADADSIQKQILQLAEFREDGFAAMLSGNSGKVILDWGSG